MSYELKIVAYEVLGRLHYVVSVRKTSAPGSGPERPRAIVNGDMSMPDTEDDELWALAVADEISAAVKMALKR